MTEPRQIIKGRTYKITRRVTQGKRLLNPKSQTIKDTFTYCLAYAAQQTGVCVHAFSVLPNRYVAVVTDYEAALPDFQHSLNMLTAKAVNSHLGRKENFFDNDKYKADVLEGKSQIVKAITETMILAVKEGFVRRLGKWKGLWSKPDRIGEEVKIERPSSYFGKNGKMPEVLRFKTTPPPCMSHLSIEEFRLKIRAAIDVGLTSLRRNRGTKSEDEGRSCREASEERERFRNAYRKALRMWRSNRRDKRIRSTAGADVRGKSKRKRKNVVFPKGTYWMERFCCVECVT